jgi:hypothetical protein
MQFECTGPEGPWIDANTLYERYVDYVGREYNQTDQNGVEKGKPSFGLKLVQPNFLSIPSGYGTDQHPHCAVRYRSARSQHSGLGSFPERPVVLSQHAQRLEGEGRLLESSQLLLAPVALHPRGAQRCTSFDNVIQSFAMQLAQPNFLPFSFREQNARN